LKVTPFVFEWQLARKWVADFVTYN
jgi:hypothetical protein